MGPRFHLRDRIDTRSVDPIVTESAGPGALNHAQAQELIRFRQHGKVNAADIQFIKEMTQEMAAALQDNLVACSELSAWLCTYDRTAGGSLNVRSAAEYALETARVVLINNMMALEIMSGWAREHAGSDSRAARMLRAAERAIVKSRAALCIP